MGREKKEFGKPYIKANRLSKIDLAVVMHLTSCPVCSQVPLGEIIILVGFTLSPHIKSRTFEGGFS